MNDLYKGCGSILLDCVHVGVPTGKIHFCMNRLDLLSTRLSIQYESILTMEYCISLYMHTFNEFVSNMLICQHFVYSDVHRDMPY